MVSALSRSGRGAATGVIAVDAPRFKLNERVECRDDGKKWWAGTVVSVDPLLVQTELERERQSAREAIERERQSAREALERERQSAREAREASLGRRLMALEAQISRTTELLHQVGLPLIASDDISNASDDISNVSDCL